MSYLYLFLFCLLYFITSLQLNFALASKNVTSVSKSKSSSNGDEEDPVYVITGGYRPEKHFLPKYVVSIRRRNKFSYRYIHYFGSTHFCGGSILNAELILSAAHCFIKYGVVLRPASLEVVTGTLKRLEKTPHTQIIEVKKVIVNRKFSRRLFSSDIALLKLKSKIDLDGTYAEAIPLPQAPPVPGTTCVTLGWGRLYNNGPLANEILYVNLKLQTESTCKRDNPLFTHGEICANDPKDFEKDSCHGDSGGPIICNGEVTGITSYGWGCESKIPSVYTDVYEYLDWIRFSKSCKLSAFLWTCQFLCIFWTTILSW